MSRFSQWWNSLGQKPAGTTSTAPKTLAERLVAAMQAKKYKLFTGQGELNTIYVEGMGPDGTKNDNKPNQFNDARFLLRFENGRPIIDASWDATTEPGKRWTERPMNPGGAARLKPGQYTAWKVGTHLASKPSGHEALVQTAAPVTVYRDKNKDYQREGDLEDTGYFGINQHGGYDMPKENLGSSSAGCLVGRTMAGHRDFMSRVKKDPRYLADRSNFVFTATLLLAKDIPEA